MLRNTYLPKVSSHYKRLTLTTNEFNLSKFSLFTTILVGAGSSKKLAVW
jgi:hypothetical protein